MTKSLPLSEAIRLGSMLRPQAFCELFTNVGSCALGAAMDAIGCPETNLARFAELYEEILNRSVVSPCECFTAAIDACFAIQHLNDDHHWTRERIADWLEPIELQAEVNQALAVCEGAIPA